MIAAFPALSDLNNKNVWRGHVMGKSQSLLLNVVRGFLSLRAGKCLAYSQLQSARVNRDLDVEAIRFNNTEVREWKCREVPYKQQNNSLNLIFVGRFQRRKKLQKLIDLALRCPAVCVRLIGPGMENLSVPGELYHTGRVECYEKMSGEDLDSHFDWADLVASPGDAGLLVMNAARHQKGIIIDSSGLHAPEYWLAKETNQPFIDFSNEDAVHDFVSSALENPAIVEEWGESLQEIARKRYTIEYMEAARMYVLGYLR